MNYPNWMFWRQVLSILGIEICGVAALGFAAQRCFASAAARRIVWQTTLACLLLLPASEWTGFGRGAANFLLGQKRVATAPAAPRAVMVSTGPARLPLLQWLMPPPPPLVWWPGWVWLAGAAVVLGRILVAQALLLALRLTRGKIADGPLRGRIVLAAGRVGLRRQVRAFWMPQSMSPMAFGIFRPCLGLPPGFAEKFSVTEQDAVLAHELAHLAAWDPVWFLLADVTSAVLWWHPLVWWARRSLRDAAELAADEATALVPQGPDALARCLVSLGREMTAARWGWVGISGGFRSNLGKRVERLTQMSALAWRPLTAWAVVAGMGVVPVVMLLAASLQAAPAQTTGTLGGELRDSWNGSPGAQLLLAALDTNPAPDGTKSDAATQIANAKLLYEMGKYKEAKAILLKVLETDPSNKSAAYYADMVKEALSKNHVSGAKAMPIPLATNAPDSASFIGLSPEHREILIKLNRIRFDELDYRNVPLGEVLSRLATESQKRDPAGKGVNFMFKPLGEGSVEPIDPGQVNITISPPLRDLRLIDAVDAIVKAADHPIKFAVEDYAVVFSPNPVVFPPPARPADTLYTKVFKVDLNTFRRSLPAGAGTNGAKDVYASLKDYFLGMGVQFDPPKLFFFNDRLGELLVRASLQDLDTIQQGVEMLNQQAAQVTIEAKFIDMDVAEAKALGIHLIDDARTKIIMAEVKILTPAQYATALAAAERAQGDVLAAPKVTTLSGRQAHIGIDSPEDKLALDLVPTVEPNGFFIETQIIPTVVANGQTWQLSTTSLIPDGGTVVMGRSISDSATGKPRMRLVFVTAQIIDAAGNRVHP